MKENNKYVVPSLPYEYDALEPYIDEATMRVHHDKHHQTYADKFNAALEKHPELYDRELDGLFRNLDEVPEDIRTMVKNHGGGYINHNMFWRILGPVGSHPSGELLNAIERDFGDFEKFREQLTNSALNQFGSGWGWLVKGSDGKLKVYSLPNQESPLSLGDTPILLIDVWEHAYYLKYQNRRAEYLENFWNVINWEEAEKNYSSS